MCQTRDDAWKLRSEFWCSQQPAPKPRKLRERSTETLVLCGHGISMRVEAGTLFIKNGFTHHPQEQEVFRYFRGDLDRPARIIVLDGSGHLTFDVIDWLAEQSIPLIRVTWQGQATTVTGGSGFAADRKKVDWQRATRSCDERRVAFGADLIARKITNSVATLQGALPASDQCDRAIEIADGALSRLRHSPPSSISELHGIEGPAAAAYFEAWQGVALRWQVSKRSPIPAAWHMLGPRASLREAKRSKNRHATHPVNAMLNYAYAITVAQLKIRALVDGYDPTLGIMHHEYRDEPAYALDLIEPMRPLVDDAVLRFAQEQELHPADFVIRPDGACRLNSQLARWVVVIAQEATTRVVSGQRGRNDLPACVRLPGDHGPHDCR